jgi:hypothetical protein
MVAGTVENIWSEGYEFSSERWNVPTIGLEGRSTGLDGLRTATEFERGKQ